MRIAPAAYTRFGGLGGCFLLAALGTSVVGCSSITGSQDDAENARVEVTGTSPVPLQLVQSTEWFLYTDLETGDELVSLISADTTEVELPFERTVAFTNSRRIYFEVRNPELEEEAEIRMRVLFDDAVMFDQSATMRDASLSFSFFFHQ